MARSNTRTYTCELPRIRANLFKSVFDFEVGNSYQLNNRNLESSHKNFALAYGANGGRELHFTIDSRIHCVRRVKNLSGVACRYFFVCPYCSKNRIDLYAATNAYACRECLHLTYVSQSEGDLDRLGRRIRTLRRKIWPKAEPWIEYDNLFEDSYYWPKPKGRWRKVFRREQTKIEQLERGFNIRLDDFILRLETGVSKATTYSTSVW